MSFNNPPSIDSEKLGFIARLEAKESAMGFIISRPIGWNAMGKPAKEIWAREQLDGLEESSKVSAKEPAPVTEEKSKLISEIDATEDWPQLNKVVESINKAQGASEPVIPEIPTKDLVSINNVPEKVVEPESVEEDPDSRIIDDKTKDALKNYIESIIKNRNDNKAYLSPENLNESLERLNDFLDTISSCHNIVDLKEDYNSFNKEFLNDVEIENFFKIARGEIDYVPEKPVSTATLEPVIPEIPAPEPTPIVQEKSDLKSKIGNIKSWDELYDVLAEIKKIEEADASYDEATLISAINEYRKTPREMFLSEIPEVLQDKVKELQELFPNGEIPAAPETLKPFEIGGQKFDRSQYVKVKINGKDGKIEDSWFIFRADTENVWLIKGEKPENGVTPEKKVSVEDFLAWNNPKQEIKEPELAEPVPDIQEKNDLRSKIANAQSFQELHDVLTGSEGIQVGETLYDSGTLMSAIDEYIETPRETNLSEIPEEEGLQDKVQELQEKLAAAGAPEQEPEKVPVPEPTPAPTTPESAPEKTPEPTTPEAVPVTPEPAPATPEPTPAPVAQEIVPEWKKGEEWAIFERSRIDRAKAELDIKKYKDSNLIDAKGNMEDREFIYNDRKLAIAEKIKESLRAEALKKLKAGESLTTKQEEDLKVETNNLLFDELVKKENDAYLNALRDNREKTWKDTVKIEAAKMLGNKVVKWYVGQNKWARLGINILLYTAAIGAGAYIGGVGTVATVAGAAGYRVARGVASLFGAEAGRRLGNKGVDVEVKGKKFKIMKPDEINKWENEETEKIKNSADGVEEKSKQLKTLNEKIAKERKKSAIYKAALNVGLGAGAGMLTGGLLHSYYGAGSHVEPVKTNQSDHATNTPPPAPTRPIVPEQTPKATIAPEPTPPPAPVPPPPPVAPMVPSPEKLSVHPEAMVQHIGHDDSLWKAIGRTLGGSKQFEGLNEAQKQNVISYFTNKAISNPAKYGLTADPQYGVRVEVGKDVDLHKLFDSPDEISKHLSIAKNLTHGQQSQIIDRSHKIAEWLKQHPHTLLTNDRVSEILSTKPKVSEIAPEAPAGPMPPMSETHHLDPTGVKSDEEYLNMVKTPKIPLMKEPLQDLPLDHKVPTEGIIPNIKTSMAGIAGAATLGTIARPSAKSPQQQLENEITDAKQRLQTLEVKRPEMRPVARSMISDVLAHRDVEGAFRREIDSIYGKNGFLGLGKVSGQKNPEWLFISELPANKALAYYTGDSERSGLAPYIMERLSKSKAHEVLVKQILGLMEKSNGMVKPYENERIGAFFRRLGDYVMRIASKANNVK